MSFSGQFRLKIDGTGLDGSFHLPGPSIFPKGTCRHRLLQDAARVADALDVLLSEALSGSNHG